MIMRDGRVYNLDHVLQKIRDMKAIDKQQQHTDNNSGS